jgi:hypothetical protein
VVAAHEYVVGGCVSAVFSKRNLSIVVPAYIRETNTCSFNGSSLVPAESRGQKITKVESNYFLLCIVLPLHHTLPCLLLGGGACCA